MTAPHETLLGHNTLTHRALLRLLEQLAARVSSGDLPSDLLQQGVTAAVTALRAHHVAEDEVMVPFLRGRAGTTDALAAIHQDHERVAAALARLERAPASDLADALGSASRTFAAHCAREEELLAGLPWTALAGPEEVRALGKGVSDASRRHLRPAPLQLALLLYNLDDEERRAFTDRMPAFVSRVLLPWAFRPSWRRMRPFLAHPPRRVLSRAGAAAGGIR
jgi:hypothetical protein